MEASKVKEILNRAENRSLKRNFRFDAADAAWRRIVLGLLQKIAKKEDEPEQLVQETGLQTFQCKYCEGDGYIEKWGTHKNSEAKIIEDCDVCKGNGVLQLEVVDKRKKSKNRPLYYGTVY